MENEDMKDTKDAFLWIIKILRKHQVIFQITGGFAAKLYGSKRPLADIDIDIPENNFKDILPDVKDHIIYGPERYLDENWDLYLMTLKYKGQEIDICGDIWKTRKDKNSEWLSSRVDFSKSEIKESFGINVPVENKADLIKYKKAMSRPVDIEDIKQICHENI